MRKRYPHRIRIEELTQVQDQDTGEITEGWREFKSVMAQVTPMSAKEFISAEAIQSQISGRVEVRYMEGLQADMRIVFRGNVYNIHGILPDNETGLKHITMPVSYFGKYVPTGENI